MSEGVKPKYKLTEVGVIPVDWPFKPLVQLCAFITKGSTPTTYGFTWQQSGVLFLRSECVSEVGLDLAQSMFISEAAHATLRRSEVTNGDILITITGNVGRVVLLAGFGTGNVNQHIARIRVVAPEADVRFVFHYLSRPESRRRFESITTGQAYPQISLQQVREAEIPLPPLPEQRAIAAALSDVDALLAKLDQLIAKKRDLKQAAMQQLLTGQTRLPGFSGEWEYKLIRSLGETYGGLMGKTKADFGHGAARYIPFMNVMSDTVIDPEWLEPVDILPTEAQNLALKGDLFFNGSSETPEEVGYCSVLMHNIPRLYLNSFCFGFRFYSDANANGLFLAYWFRSISGRRAMSALAQGATR